MARAKQESDPFENDDFSWGDGASGGPAESGEMPEPSSEEKPPFLKPYHLTQDRGKLELVRVTRETSEYSDVVLLVTVNGKHYRLGLKLFSEDYKSLSKRYGKNKADWHGDIQFKVMPHKGNPRGYVAIR